MNVNKQVNIEAASGPETAGENGGATWRDFIQLTKPGIIRSNLVATFAGFWLAAKWQVDWLLLIATLAATALVMASSCVLNNYLDRDMDEKMERTKKRTLPAGRLHPNVVFGYGAVLGAAGLVLFYLLVNPLTVLLAFVGMFVYVIVYTAWLKRTSTWSTSVGGISGAMPPVIGYCAVTGTVDVGALLLFAFLFLWQPPHFWALGIRRREEYRIAGFPLLPVVKGVRRTKFQMIPYVALLIPVTVLFYVYHLTGVIFLVVSVALSVLWLLHTAAGLKVRDEENWAKKNFVFSVNYLMLTLIVMVLDTTRLA